MRAILLVLLAVFAHGASSVAAQPQIPSTFFGTASIDGAAPPADTDLRAFVDGQDCTQIGPGLRYAIEDGIGTYVLNVMHESQKAGCGREGKTVTFTIAGRTAEQTAAWKPGPQEVNLNVGSGTPIPLPSRTPTPTARPGASQTNSPPSDDPGTGTPPRPTGTPPTDDITLTPVARGSESPPGNGRTPGDASSAASAAGGSGTPGGGEGGSAWPILLVAGGLVALAGGGAGLALSRRLHKPAAE